ncbi:MAG: hypothetical protein H8E44_37260 [Planctomycetes bacterium]|nr:hypothetical protein [Planctomycetota bacterium]MBL7040940.1 hypothetical protein [Pirellulaceae bacterium]
MDTEAANVFDVLTRHGVPFVVIGGHAVNYHGYIRATEDHDVVLLRSPESEAAFLRACDEMNAAWISDEIDPSTGLERLVPVSSAFVQGEHLMMLWTDHGYLDVFDYIPGFPDESVNELFRTSEELHGIRFVSLEWLRKMKRASGRPRDLDDLENLAD